MSTFAFKSFYTFVKAALNHLFLILTSLSFMIGFYSLLFSWLWVTFSFLPMSSVFDCILDIVILKRLWILLSYYKSISFLSVSETECTQILNFLPLARGSSWNVCPFLSAFPLLLFASKLECSLNVWEDVGGVT